jgi:heme/copper-type cytochrome/quinol oxidase subunit 2
MLQALELRGGNTALSVQVSGFQWGWRYGYGESAYLDLVSSSINVGWDSGIRMLGAGSLVGTTAGNEVCFNRSFLKSIGSLTLSSGVGPEAATWGSLELSMLRTPCAFYVLRVH